MIKNYILLGAPGVGKGTMAAMATERLGFKHISTGDMFRDHIKRNTSIGKEVKAILDSGEYVPDELTNRLIKETISENSDSSIILDGYPRTINQANFLKEINFDLTAAILLDAPDNLIQERLESRAKKEKRTDDNSEVIANRIRVYKEKTSPLIDFYKKENKLLIVNSSGTIEENYKIFKKELI